MGMCRNGSIYRREVGWQRDEDGLVEPIVVEVTREANGVAIWTPLVADEDGLFEVEENCGLYLYVDRSRREEAVERAVDIVLDLQATKPVGYDDAEMKPLLLDKLVLDEPAPAIDAADQPAEAH